uniref:Bestrophin homolog n=1 Tax=Heterorhabditis bacteriophora TaxID=37862 RepID=A0A1I7XR15_HETBA
MAYEMGGLFTPPPQHHNIWGTMTQQYIRGVGSVSGMNNMLSGGSMGGIGGPYSGHTLDMQPLKAESIQGYGQLTWLSGKAGLITCKNKMVISFQIKDFCDQMLTDLTAVLRVGFTLSFQASLNETNEYTATLVQPLYGPEAEQVFVNAPEVDLEKACPTPPNSKDAYAPLVEARAIPALLAIFQRHGLTQIQLSSLHSQMSNCGDEELFRLTPEDNIALQFVLFQSPAVYLCVLRLASYLLRRGGATAIQSLYEYYVGPEMAMEIRDQIGEGRQDFLNLVVVHPWIFALFPNRTYVSVRRNLPHYDYPGFIKQHFPDLDALRPPSSRGGYGPRPIARSMSAHQPLVSALSNGRGSINQTSHRPGSLWDSQATIPQAVPPLQSPAEQWSPLFSPAWNRTASISDRVLPTHSSSGVIGTVPISQNKFLLAFLLSHPGCFCLRAVFPRSGISVMLGFTTVMCITRWTDTYNLLIWPENAAIMFNSSFNSAAVPPGKLRIIRISVHRYLLLSYILLLRDISIPVRKRFPTYKHLIESNILTE